MTRKILPFFIGVSILFLIFTGVSFSQEKMSNEDCLTCHSDKDLEAQTDRGKTLKLFVPEKPLIGSVHEGMSCTECHIGEKSFDDVPHSPKGMTKACPDCHEDAKQSVDKDIHGKACIAGNPRSPSCCACHGGHQIKPLTSAESVFSKKNQPDTCGKCHDDDTLLGEEKGITKRNLVSRYKTSVHWEAISQGKNAASCTDCHGTHNILSSNAPESTVSRTGLVAACNKCHPNEARSFWSGAHGTALLHGNHDVPTCTTCHGDHDMASLKMREGDAKQWASTQVCMWCHGNARMMKRYGLDTAPVDSYMNDFHGLTQRGTLGASATCADCHDPHHSLPTDHPSSRMHISNRGPTCGKCHGKVTDSFTMSFSHKAMAPKDGLQIEGIIRTLYILLIVFAVMFMLFYNFLIWFKAVRDKIKSQRQQKHINRMNRMERVTHMTLFISFSVLVITGFALKYPDAWWVKFLFSIGVNETIRAFIHRTAAIVMTVDFGIFMLYMFIAKRGKCVLKEMLPRFSDIGDFFDLLKYYLGIKKGDHPPKQPVFGFVEKFEFWALVWGTLVMVVSGLLLWFPKVIIPGSWPSWILNVARTVHFYEALLATLAIIIWHGFHTMFHPHEYPMNTSWITGYISEPDAKGHFSDEAIEKMKK
jgi:cytochrome b subunit of formate dehydrogenase